MCVVEYLAGKQHTQLEIMKACKLSGADWRKVRKYLLDHELASYTISAGHLKYWRLNKP